MSKPYSEVKENIACRHDNMEMIYAPIAGGGGAVLEPIGESCPDCGYSPDALAIAIRKTYEFRYDD